jgi:NAD(P)-dependent dehydrogenase (short-subunit alcohol dehydrogenase family)
MLGPQGATVLADSSNLGDLDRLYELINREAARIDILFANAGGGSNLPLGSITEDQYDDTLGRNVKLCCSPCRRRSRCSLTAPLSS